MSVDFDRNLVSGNRDAPHEGRDDLRLLRDGCRLTGVGQLGCAREQGRDLIWRLPFKAKIVEQRGSISQEADHLLQHKVLDLVRGKTPAFCLEACSASVDLTPDCLFFCRLGRQQRSLDIVAVPPAVVDGVGRREWDTFGGKQEASEQAWVLRVGSPSLATGIGGELCLHLVPGLSVNDGIMLAFIAATLMWNAAYIESVGEDEVKVSVAERLAANPSSIEQCALFGFEPQSVRTPPATRGRCQA